MAAATMNVESKGKKARVRGKLPETRYINMATVGQKKTSIVTALLVLILILVAAAAIAKFAVMDRLTEVDQAERKVRDMRTQLSAANAKLDSFGELKEKYAHYTLADFTNEELNRVDRSDVVELINNVILPVAELKTWNVKKNQLTMNITMDTLQDTNLLVQELNENEMVTYASVKSAVTVALPKPSPEPNPAEGAEGTEGEAPAEGAEGEAPADSGESGETPAEGEAEGEAEQEEELLYRVNAQIIAYLTAKEG